MKLALPIVDNTLFLSASSLTSWLTCPQLYYVGKILNKETVKDKPGRDFGFTVHKGLAKNYSLLHKPMLERLQAVQLVLDDEFFGKEIHPENHRTLTYANDLFSAYLKQYPTEPFVVPEFQGKPLIERSFNIPLCQFTSEAYPEPITVIWTGIIDLVVKYIDGSIETLDHKTSIMGGERFFDPFYHDLAQLGYCWAARKLGIPVNSFTVNGLICPPPLKSGLTNFKFLRQRIPVDTDRIIEWEENVIKLINLLFYQASTGDVPLYRNNCVGRYGRCDLYELCSFSPNSRQAILDGTMFRIKKPSPIYGTED